MLVYNVIDERIARAKNTALKEQNKKVHINDNDSVHHMALVAKYMDLSNNNNNNNNLKINN